MNRILIIVLLSSILTSGCYIMEYNYDYQVNPYDGRYYPTRTEVRYYSPLEPIIDLAILGAVLHGWRHVHPRTHYYVPSHNVSRIRR